jgi:hypothetical protein
MKLERTLTLLAAVSVLCGAGAAFAQAANDFPGNLTINGSMDFVDADGRPSAQGGVHFAGDPEAALAGWTFLDPAPSAEYWASFQTQASPDGGSYLGIQDLDGAGPRVNVQGITQTISGLTVGEEYALWFWSMSNHDGHGVQDWSVTFGDQTQTSAQTTPNADGSGTWTLTVTGFVASATSQALTFVPEYLPGSESEVLDLDGVVLVDIPPVPEPPDGALLLAGLGGAMAFARLRRTR